MDGLADKYSFYSPYQFAGNEVPNAIDMDGLEPASPTNLQVDQGNSYHNQWGQDISYIYDPWSISAGTSKDGMFSLMTEDGTHMFYWINRDRTPGVYSPNAKDKNGNWTGKWKEYLTAEQLDAKAGAESANFLSEGFSLLLTLPLAAEEGAMFLTTTNTEGLTTELIGKAFLNYYRFAPIAGTVGTAAAAILDESGGVGLQNSAVTLYRNMGELEYRSLQTTQKFSILPTAYNGKQFWIGEEGWNFWKSTTFANDFNVSVTLPRSFITPGSPNYIFAEGPQQFLNGVPHIDGYPGGTVLPEKLDLFNSIMQIQW